MSLLRALKVKNHLAARIADLEARIIADNSVPAGNQHEFDIRSLLQERQATVDSLVAIKAAISKANAPIQEVIYRLAELKATVAFLQRVDTTHGKRLVRSYGAEMLEYDAQLRATEAEEMLRECRRQIDDLQDRLDAFNSRATIDVTVPDALLY